jgi:hypothetical protein
MLLFDDSKRLEKALNEATPVGTEFKQDNAELRQEIADLQTDIINAKNEILRWMVIGLIIQDVVIIILLLLLK